MYCFPETLSGNVNYIFTNLVANKKQQYVLTMYEWYIMCYLFNWNVKSARVPDHMYLEFKSVTHCQYIYSAYI